MSRALLPHEYHAFCTDPNGYPWAQLVPLVAEKPAAKPAAKVKMPEGDEGTAGLPEKEVKPESPKARAGKAKGDKRNE